MTQVSRGATGAVQCAASTLVRQPSLPFGVRTLNRIGQALRRWGASVGDLSEVSVLRTAQRRTGLSDFGDSDYLTPLRELLASYDSDTSLTFLGRLIARGMLVHALANRLRIREAAGGSAGVSPEMIVRPLFVVGLPRTGTTLLYNLLAQDPAARPLMFWESMTPTAPRSGRGRDQRIREAERTVARLNRLVPELRMIHEMDPRGPDECTGLLFNTLVCPYFRGRLARYRQWLFTAAQQRITEAYREYREQLQILQRQRRNEHWVLKSPSHLFGLGSLLEVFPDAAVVFTHRDPAQALASLCSLTAALDTMSYRGVDLADVGRRNCAIVEQLILRGQAARHAPQGSRIFDVKYEDLVRDPLKIVRLVYERFGYRYTPDFEQRCRDHLRDNPQHKHGRHRYTLEEFGLDRSHLPPLVEEYRKELELPRE